MLCFHIIRPISHNIAATFIPATGVRGLPKWLKSTWDAAINLQTSFWRHSVTVPRHLSQSHCRHTGSTYLNTMITDTLPTGRLGQRPQDHQLPEQQPRDGRDVLGHDVLPAGRRQRGRHHRRHPGRQLGPLQRQDQRQPPGAHVRLARQGALGPDGGDLRRQRRQLVQDLPGAPDRDVQRARVGLSG